MKKFHGVGPATAEKMHRLGIETGADIKERSVEFLTQHFGKAGTYFYGIARGLDTREVQPDRERKSIGAEDTFTEDVFELETAREQLHPLVSKVCQFCSNNDTGGKTVTLKVKYSDFQTITRSRTSPVANRTEASVWMVLEPLLQSVFPTRKGIRLLGISLGILEGADQNTQLDLAL
ncbi:DNA polymerase-4 [Rhizobium tibeticum]|uniref:DNA-directed DNA polymerase n=1 Tax=Rhizobium tibeticum TaxID=501024 RepID=A0A1H8TFN3_9HYPH|nr:DNA polymerase IV [Rhizobium tibeticum]SEO89566.1 DNA polymerase-4 [Rhizobium tibeticum]